MATVMVALVSTNPQMLNFDPSLKAGLFTHLPVVTRCDTVIVNVDCYQPIQKLPSPHNQCSTDR